MMKVLKALIASALVGAGLGLLVVAGYAATYYNGPGPGEDKVDTLAAVTLPNATGTVTWTNDVGWSRMVSVGIALTNSITTTATVTVVRSAEGVNDIIASIDGTAESFRWTALNANDVIVRLGDKVTVNVVDTNTAGTVFLSLDRTSDR